MRLIKISKGKSKEIRSYPSIKRNNLVEMIFNALKKDILSGALPKGELLLPQDVLAQQFGVSRTVIREAFNKLSSLGLIKSHQGKGTFVRSPNAKNVIEPMLNALYLDESSTRELMETRYYLERAVARLAAKRAKSEDIAPLQRIIDNMRQHAKSGDIEAYAKEDFSFHLRLSELSKNDILNRILETIREIAYVFLTSFSRTEGAQERAIDFHQRILNAVAERDPDMAEREMQLHILDIIKTLRKLYEFDLDI